MKQYQLNQTVVNALPAEIAVLDSEGRVIAANESWDGLCGLSPGVNCLSFHPQAAAPTGCGKAAQ